MPGLDQLAKTRDAKARRDVVGILPVALGLALVQDAAALGGCDAHDEVELVLLRQVGPRLLQVAVVLRRHREPRTVVDPVVVKEDAENLVALLQRRLGELIGAIGSLVRVRALVYENAELQCDPPFLWHVGRLDLSAQTRHSPGAATACADLKSGHASTCSWYGARQSRYRGGAW